MTIKTTRWSPDTCQCVLEYTWDDSVPNDQITTTPATVVSKCSVHAALPDNTAVFNTVLEENPKKNQAFQHLLDNGPASIVDIEAQSGTKVLKNGLRLDFSWTGTPPNRVLVLTLTGIALTTAQKNNAQTFLNNKFGTGKVIFVNS